MTNYPVTNLIRYDLEVYPNYFLAGFMLPNKEVRQYQFTESDFSHLEPLKAFIQWAQENGYTFAGFNSKGYDDAVLSEFLLNPSLETPYDVTEKIIIGNTPAWKFQNLINSVDLMQILPGRIGLKKIGVCLGHKKLQELPIPPGSRLTPEQMQTVAVYNVNDLEITDKLLHAVQEELNLRSLLSQEYGADVRSKGEAAAAEEILTNELSKATKVRKWELKETAKARADAKPWVEVKPPTWWGQVVELSHLNPYLLNVVDRAKTIFATQIPIVKTPEGKRLLKKGFLNYTVFIGDRWYSMGIGGLHSVDGAGMWEADEEYQLLDVDVTSYYPFLMITQNLFPEQCGPAFRDVFEGIVNQRLEAKSAGDKKIADVLKIVINGTYGKTAESHSALFDPRVTVNVTVRGQLSLLVLIAMVTWEGGTVISANTDGITVKCKRSMDQRIRDIVSQWEAMTELNMEYAPYTRFLQSNVNNYIAVKTNGDLKTVGSYKIPQLGGFDLRHTPNYQICARAVGEYIKSGTPVEETVYGCRDIQEFILTQQVKGAWEVTWRGMNIGKMIRWYRSTNGDPIIRTPLDSSVKGNQGTVANGDSSVPLPDLPDEFPDDVDYQWYIQKANEWLKDITQPKQEGLNRLAYKLVMKDLIPVVIDTTKKSSRARPSIGELDFSSLKSHERIGCCTGVGTGVLAKVDSEGKAITLYRVKRNYPSTTRPLILRDHGFALVYGRNVELASDTNIVDVSDEGWLEQYYTEAERKKVNV